MNLIISVLVCTACAVHGDQNRPNALSVTKTPTVAQHTPSPTSAPSEPRGTITIGGMDIFGKEWFEWKDVHTDISMVVGLCWIVLYFGTFLCRHKKMEAEFWNCITATKEGGEAEDVPGQEIINKAAVKAALLTHERRFAQLATYVFAGVLVLAFVTWSIRDIAVMDNWALDSLGAIREPEILILNTLISFSFVNIIFQFEHLAMTPQTLVLRQTYVMKVESLGWIFTSLVSIFTMRGIIEEGRGRGAVLVLALPYVCAPLDAWYKYRYWMHKPPLLLFLSMPMVNFVHQAVLAGCFCWQLTVIGKETNKAFEDWHIAILVSLGFGLLSAIESMFRVKFGFVRALAKVFASVKYADPTVVPTGSLAGCDGDVFERARLVDSASAFYSVPNEPTGHESLELEPNVSNPDDIDCVELDLEDCDGGDKLVEGIKHGLEESNDTSHESADENGSPIQIDA